MNVAKAMHDRRRILRPSHDIEKVLRDCVKKAAKVGDDEAQAMIDAGAERFVELGGRFGGVTPDYMVAEIFRVMMSGKRKRE